MTPLQQTTRGVVRRAGTGVLALALARGLASGLVGLPAAISIVDRQAPVRGD